MWNKIQGCCLAELIRKFETGATRDIDVNKYDYEAFFSPLVLEARAKYMHKHRQQPDGSMRDGDNWQKGIPLNAYMKSGFRHFFDWWKGHRGLVSREALIEGILALMFNAEGYLHELLKPKQLPTPGQIIPVKGDPRQFSLSRLRGEDDLEAVQAHLS